MDTVGGKNASLGEMIGALKDAGVRVPGGFATTADAYREFLRANDLDDQLKEQLDKLKQDLPDRWAADRPESIPHVPSNRAGRAREPGAG